MTRKKVAKPSYQPVDWRQYRIQKKYMFYSLAGYIPVILLCTSAIKIFPGHDNMVYTVFCAYMLLWTLVFLSYLACPCPNCGNSLNGCQIYSKTCQKCGIVINPPEK